MAARDNYWLTLESFDTDSKDAKPAVLKTDIILIQVTPCAATADTLAAIQMEVDKIKLEFNLVSRVEATQELSYKDSYLKIGQLAQGCDIMVNLVSTHPFLSHDSAA